MKKLLSILLSLCLGLFLAGGAVSVADDSLVLLFGLHLLTMMSVILTFIAMLMAILVYGLMGLTPMIPKRVFLPVILFYVAALLAVFPILIYYYDRMVQIDWILSFCQVILGLGLLWWLRGGLKFHWPIVEDKHLGDRGFSWLNLVVFLLVNVFGVLPAMVIYTVLCATLAVNHFSGGFMALHPGGMTVQVRKYVRNDGKTIQLIPMAHIADAGFYQKVAQSFPSNSIILMEGVTDRQHLITTGTSYKRMARALHMAEQHEEFKPTRGEMVRADMDVDQFSTNTVDFINLVMLVHSKGITPATGRKVLQFSPTPDFQKQVFGDLLRKRNRHLWEEIQARLPQTDNIIVPWGVAHMPEIAAEIQKAGFRLNESQDYSVIKFHSIWKK
jgi:hypothetical protein